jgi:SAM-dependent methyltransferase
MSAMRATARYEGLASWYDENFAWYADPSAGPAAEVLSLLGPGPGFVLDVGCGTGLFALALRDAGWTVGGMDVSADQLSVATGRCAWTVRGDATRLPFADHSVPRAVVLLVHTDVDHYGPLLREVARVVAPGGEVVHLGVHPCFVGHHIEAPDRGEERLAVVPGYREGGWVLEHENFGPGVRGRIGARHVPLAELLNAFAAADLHIREVREAGPHLVPWMLGLRATTAV